LLILKTKFIEISAKNSGVRVSRFPVQKCFLTEEADFQRLCAEADELLDSASSGNVAMAEKRLVGADQVAVLWVAVGLMAEVGSPNKGVETRRSVCLGRVVRM